MDDILTGMECDDWGLFVECKEQFLAYPQKCAWLSFGAFRIYLTSETFCEYLDVFLRNWEELRWVMCQLELLAGGTDIRLFKDSAPFHFAVQMMKSIGDSTY